MILPTLRRWSLLLPLSGLGCLSSAPPAPPVRWFDPLPPAASPRPAARYDSVRVTAAPHLGREFVLRTGPRELQFDGQHQWVGEPRLLLATALVQAFGGAIDGPRGVRHLSVDLELFEFELVGAPVARVRLVLAEAAAPRVVETTAPAAGRAPEQLAAAMAEAIGEAVARVAAVR